MGFLLNAICDLLYAPAVRADTRRAQEMYRESDRKMVAQWAKEAKELDCWYTGSTVVAPHYSYWSDGSIKIDGWTKDYYPKGMYYLNSRGQNAVLKEIPPGAKRCPTRMEQLRQDCEKRGIPFPE